MRNETTRADESRHEFLDDQPLATQIAIDLSTGELSDVESPLILDIVTRTLEALNDFGYECVPIDPPEFTNTGQPLGDNHALHPDYGTPTTYRLKEFEDLTFIVDPAEEEKALIREAWADVKLATEVYQAAVDYALAARLEEIRTRDVSDIALKRLADLLQAKHA